MSEEAHLWKDTSATPRDRAKALVAAMTLDQKIAQLHGAMETIDIYAITSQAVETGEDMDQLAAQIRVERHVKAIEELAIPRFRITNGPVGVGMGDGTPSPPATSLPMTICLAAGFDPELARTYGDIIGSETATLGGSATVTKITVADDLSNLEEARDAATSADLVVLMAGLVATEGADQADMNMLNDQNRLIAEIGPVNPKTVVVLKDGNPVLMPWIEAVPAVIETWNQGAEDGHAVADLLFGVVNPSGKLPTTYPRSEDDTLYAGHPERYPGTDEGDGYPVMRYSEGLQLGYRWYQAQSIEPLFGFGFGLSYTSFSITDVAVDAQKGAQAPVTVTATVTNTGSQAGAAVAQVYLGVPVDGQPPKRLVGFQKVFVEPGESRQVEIGIDPEATNHPFSVWDYGANSFVIKPGEYTVHVGTSADSTPHSAMITVS